MTSASLRDQFSKVKSYQNSFNLPLGSGEVATTTTQPDPRSQPPGKQISRSATNPIVIGSAELRSSQEDGRLITTSQQRSINVILCGDMGVGKSAIINLIAGHEVAGVSSDVDRCTLQTTRYDIPIDDMNFCIFDTIGLGPSAMWSHDHTEALPKAHELVIELGNAGGVHLLLFAMRGGRIATTTLSNYQLFTEVFCQARVPIALVFTGLEWEVEMEDWWTRNKTHIANYGIRSDGHACITTVQDDVPGEDLKYTESQKRIRELLKSCYLKNEAFLPQEHVWFARFSKGMQSFIAKNRNPKGRDVMKVLTHRSKLDPEMARKIADMMERGDERSSSGDDKGRSHDASLARAESREEKARSPNLDTGTQEQGSQPPDVRSQDSDPRKWYDELQIGSVVEMASRNLDIGRGDHEPLEASVVQTIKSRDLDVMGKEDKNGERDNKVRKRAITARKVNTPVKKHINNEMDTPINDIRSNSPCDLTGQVTKSSSHPFASGGFGDIYKGNFNMRGRLIDVAIKTTRMYLEQDQRLPKKIKQFRREVTVWLELEHPNVLPLLGTIRDPSTHPDIPAMVCPWVENGALSTYLERNNDLTVTKRLVLVNDAAHGLQYLHSQHVVHGDLSGSNVLVNGDGRACIADFGLSTLLTRLGGSTFATTHQAKGTTRWMAPELLDPEDDSQTTATMQSDVYSFGSIMLQILTGRIPYHYLSRNEQVILAIGRGTRPRRPDEEAVTDHRWKFIEWCWSSAKGTKPRPSSSEIIEFTEKELAEIMTAEV